MLKSKDNSVTKRLTHRAGTETSLFCDSVGLMHLILPVKTVLRSHSRAFPHSSFWQLPSNWGSCLWSVPVLCCSWLSHAQPWVLLTQTQTFTQKLVFLAWLSGFLITVDLCNDTDSWLNTAAINKYTQIILPSFCGTASLLMRSLTQMFGFLLPDRCRAACLWCSLTVYTCYQENENYSNIFPSI